MRTPEENEEFGYAPSLELARERLRDIQTGFPNITDEEVEHLVRIGPENLHTIGDIRRALDRPVGYFGNKSWPKVWSDAGYRYGDYDRAR